MVGNKLGHIYKMGDIHEKRCKNHKIDSYIHLNYIRTNSVIYYIYYI
jgi:hypothetical protein